MHGRNDLTRWLRPLSVAFGLVAAVTAACSKQPGSSHLQHNFDQPLRDGAAWNWQSATDDDYEQIMMPLFGLDPSTLVKNDDPLVVRTQFWLDQLDGTLRRKHPQAFAQVPKPRAKVLNIAVPNAFVAPIPTCYHVAVELPEGRAGRKERRLYLDSKSGMVETFPAPYQCKRSSGGDLATVQGFVSSFNAGSSACKFSFNAAGSLVPGSACGRDADVAGLSGSDELILLQTASFVTVHSAIIKIMSEPAFVSVLAHELGHYYRSHSTAPREAYDYFYTMQWEAPGQKPAPEADKHELGEAAVQAISVLSADDSLLKVEGQKLRSELYFAVGSLVAEAAAADDASFNCQAAATLLDSSLFSLAMGTFPVNTGAAPNEAQSFTYGLYEDAARLCLADLQIGTGGVSWSHVRALAAKPTWPQWTTTLQGAGAKAFQKLTTVTAQRLSRQHLAASGPVYEALAGLSEVFATQDEQALAALKRLRELHLGQYTTEQEADDEAAEWTASLGIDPGVEVEAMRSLGKGGKVGLRGEVLAQDACEVLWRRHWLDADGQQSYVPIGNLLDPHHSICYRMFNIEREIKAHHEQAAPVSIPQADGPTWSDLQAARLTLASDAAPAPHLSGFMQKHGGLDCTYSYLYQQ